MLGRTLRLLRTAIVVLLVGVASALIASSGVGAKALGSPPGIHAYDHAATSTTRAANTRADVGRVTATTSTASRLSTSLFSPRLAARPQRKGST